MNNIKHFHTCNVSAKYEIRYYNVEKIDEKATDYWDIGKT